MLLALACCGSAWAVLTPEEATKVGGDLNRVGGGLSALDQKLAGVKASLAKIMQAVPDLPADLEKVRVTLAAGRDHQQMALSTLTTLAVLAGMFGAGVVFKRATRGWRTSRIADGNRSRGAIGLIVLDLGHYAVVSVTAYLAIRLWFDAQDLHSLLGVATLWGVLRWLLFWKFLGVILRPDLPGFRLLPMSDRAAGVMKRMFGLGTLVGILNISWAPVALRAGLPVPSGQLVVLLVGVFVAACCLLGVLAYAASQRGSGDMARFWIRLGLVLTPSILLAWIVGVVTLEFAVYHSLVYTLRIAVIAYFAYHIFELSTRAKWWYKLVQHAIAAGAILSLSIMLSELWLVERMGLIAMAQWAPIRHSLETTAITLFAGFIGWRYLDLWTEERLRAASGGLSPTQMDEEIAVEPASRLTTALPLVRVLSGVAILFFVAFLGMSQLGVDVTTLLAGAGVFGLALSFGSQALVRDIVSGVFFMSDDAFRVGEYIDTGRLKGTVERVTLRSVRLRHQNGQIHTIPFGQLNSISNFSRDWQTVKFNLRLARDTDIEKARKSVKRVGQELLQDPEFGKEFLLPLKLQGMAEITDSALVMRLKFTVKPTNPSIIQREALKRIHGAFAKDGIEFAAGVITVQPAGAPVLPAAAAAAATAAAATAAEAAAQPAA
jgi:small-conductance mechanosensitive channel